jgi:hypothetical protein
LGNSSDGTKLHFHADSNTIFLAKVGERDLRDPRFNAMKEKT